MLELKGKSLMLRSAITNDKKDVFNWLTNSNLTCEMMGPPNFPDIPIPTWEEFDNDYLNHYFDGSLPLSGQSFILVHDGQSIGHINYNKIDTIAKSTEIDIWLADRRYTCKGLGTEAINILCSYLEKKLDCKTIFIAPSRRNTMAIKSYLKAGFVESQIHPEGFIPDYDDTLLMSKSRKTD